MLTYLRIRELALVEDVTIEPGAGLVAFTGETGAGKSIILGGLDLVSGKRAALDQVRAGADEALVEAVFDVAGQGAVSALLEAEGVSAPGDEVLVRRRISATGSRAYVNDEVVTVGLLERLGALLVDLVGQHESQTLLGASAQLELLDAHAGLAPHRDRVGVGWDRAVALDSELDELRRDDRDRAQRADFLRFQIDEIRAAELGPEEEVELAAERRRLRNADALVSAADAALDRLYEGEDSASVLIAQAERELETLLRLDPDAPVPAAEIKEARFSVEETSRTLQGYRDNLSADPERLETVEARLSEIDKLRRKYGDSVAQVLACADAAEAELASIQNRDAEIERLAASTAAAVQAYDVAARELGALRQKAAESLQDAITTELQDLGMDGARFVAALATRQRDAQAGLPPGATRAGYEGVEFQLAANPGEPERPLSRVASGGEMSRVLLALKLAAVGSTSRRTLVFDEIDAGIGGGQVAERLADRLLRLAEGQQVLVVTHLPQIAARAGVQIKIHKQAEGDRTAVQAQPLDRAGRIEELARMLGGDDGSGSGRLHARELLERER